MGSACGLARRAPAACGALAVYASAEKAAPLWGRDEDRRNRSLARMHQCCALGEVGRASPASC